MPKDIVKNPDLIPLFGTLRELLKPYERYFTPHEDRVGYYDLWSQKEVVIAGKKRKEVFFAGLIIQKDYVGLYYMPVYADDELKRFFGPELLATLKGKSCFYIKKDDPVILAQIKEALELGLRLYKDRGWV